MDAAILDTDMLSEVLKRKDQTVLSVARQYLTEHQRFAFSDMTVYEITRGLKATQATRQLADFLKTVATSDVFPISRSVLMRASELWVEGRIGGHPHPRCRPHHRGHRDGASASSRHRQHAALCVDQGSATRRLARGDADTTEQLSLAPNFDKRHVFKR